MIVEKKKQRKWQLRMLLERKCSVCGDPRKTAYHCEYHAAHHANRQRDYRKNKLVLSNNVLDAPTD